jgi:hypothetical protein
MEKGAFLGGKFHDIEPIILEGLDDLQQALEGRGFGDIGIGPHTVTTQDILLRVGGGQSARLRGFFSRPHPT